MTKAFNSASVTAGGSSQTFTLTVHNTGVSNADNLHLTDTVDPRLQVQSTSVTSRAALRASRWTARSRTSATSETATLTVTYNVGTTTESDAAVPNEAHVASNEDTATSNTDNVAITENVSLVVTKHFTDDSVDAGTFGHTFTIAVQNTGVSQADNVSLTDTVDPRLHVTNIAGDFTCGAPSQSISCTLTHLNSGDTKSITVTYDVATGTAAAASVSNTANATADDGGAGSSTDTVAITTHANIADVKVDSPDPVIAGNQLTFTITATNAGPSDALNTTVHDTLNSHLTGATYCVDTGTGCVPAGAWMGQVNLGTLEPGDSVDVVITATVDPATPEHYVLNNVATITTDTTDDDLSDNTSATTTTVDTQADLSVTKGGPATATAGDPAGFNYLLTVHNDGPSDNAGFHLTDTLPAGLTFQTSGSSAGCSAAGQLVTCTSGVLAAGANKPFTLHVTLASTVDSGTHLLNSATVTSDHTLDPDHGNDTSNETDTTVQEDVHLSVSKTFASPSVTAGGAPSSFTISVTNSGLSDADNLNVTDNVDPRLIVDSITAGDYTCDPASQSVHCTLGHLAAGATKSITVNFHVNTATEADPTVPNTANAASDENTAAPSTTSVAITEDVNLVMTKTFADDNVDAGTGGHTFTVTVKNTGVSQADNVSLSDTVDSRLVVDSVAAGSYSCPDGDSNAQTITCTLAHLDTNDTKAITVTYHVPSNTPAAASVSNTANATADNGGSGSATDTVEITRHADVADLKVAAATVVAGNQITFTITVTNNGPSDADPVTLTDTLDSHLTGAQFCTGSGCVPSAPWTGSTNLGPIAPGVANAVEVKIKATVNPNTPQGYPLNNTASVSSTTPDPNSGNNSSSTSTTVETKADLSVTKTDGVTNVTAGDGITRTYTITVSNAGPSDAAGVTLTDVWPSGFARSGAPTTSQGTCTGTPASPATSARSPRAARPRCR